LSFLFKLEIGKANRGKRRRRRRRRRKERNRKGGKMITLQDICDLEFYVLSFIFKKWHLLNTNCKEIFDLKKLYTDVGYFKQDFLELLPEYRAHLEDEFESLEVEFDYLMLILD
jgi:hypothetical protein